MSSDLVFFQREISDAHRLFVDRITYLANLFRGKAVVPLCESSGLDFVSGRLSKQLLGLPNETYFFYDPSKRLLVESVEEVSRLSACSLSQAAEVFDVLNRRMPNGCRFGLLVPSFINS
jgi:hypothetical protein